jgi:hypothetical protein
MKCHVRTDKKYFFVKQFFFVFLVGLTSDLNLTLLNVCMSVQQLIAGDYSSFLCFPDYASIIPRIGRSSDFKCKSRAKTLAVSTSGKVFRMRLNKHGYNDRFVMEDNDCVLSYVCGNAEERRRQCLNRPGDVVCVELGDGKDRHALLCGVFKRIEASPDPKPDGTELLIARAYISIIGYETPDGNIVHFQKTESLSLQVTKKVRSIGCEHLILDTESAAPLDRRLLGRRHDPFPILEVAYYRTGHDFDCVYKMRSTRLAYSKDLLSKLGNDERSGVLKYPIQELHDKGDDAAAVMDDLVGEMRRVAMSGGFVFAHNVRHDIGQIRATMRLLEAPAGVKVRAIDTVKTAGHFVEGAEDGRWMKLSDVAKLCHLSTSGAINGRLHCAADDALLLLNVIRSAFPSDQLDALSEEYTV